MRISSEGLFFALHFFKPTHIGANSRAKKGVHSHPQSSNKNIDPPVRPAVPGRARSCPVQRRKPSQFRPPTLTRRSPRWHSLGQRTKLPQTITISSPFAFPSREGSGRRLGSVWGDFWTNVGPPRITDYYASLCPGGASGRVSKAIKRWKS